MINLCYRNNITLLRKNYSPKKNSLEEKNTLLLKKFNVYEPLECTNITSKLGLSSPNCCNIIKKIINY